MVACTLASACGSDDMDARADGDAPAAMESIAEAHVSAWGDTAAPQDPSNWLVELPADLEVLEIGPSTSSHSCLFTIGTAVRAPPGVPPVYVVWFEKQAAHARAHCGPTGFVVVGESFIQPEVLLAVQPGRRFVVGSYTTTVTPSGAAYVHLQLVHIAFQSGEILHDSRLSALPPAGSGRVEGSTLKLLGNGTLIVTGSKNGVLPDEQGSGPSFVAVYRRFVFDAEISPTPTYVRAF